MGFMCSHKLDSTLADEPSIVCPSGFVSAPQTPDFCYKVVTDQNTGWNEAQSYCKGLEKETKVPTNLVSIEDIYEDNYVASFFHSAETNFDPTLGGLNGMWIGLSAHKTTGNDIRYRWTDEFPTAYTRWGVNQPNSADIKLEPDYSCVYIDKDRNWFIDAGCNLRQPFICKANIAKIEPAPPRDDRGDLLPCPADWVASSSNGMGHWCLKAFAREYSWYEADNICKANFGSRLVSIHSDHFNDRV